MPIHPTKSQIRNSHRGRFFDHPERYIEDIDPRVLFSGQHGLCALCNKPLTERYQIDHDWPLWMGGEHSMKNCQCIHIGCHKRKTWMEQQYYEVWKASLRVARIHGRIRANMDFAAMFEISDMQLVGV